MESNSSGKQKPIKWYTNNFDYVFLAQITLTCENNIPEYYKKNNTHLDEQRKLYL